MELGLKGRVAIVTGASKGIGKAISTEFAKEGADLAICARGKGSLEETETLLSGLGARVVAGTVDISRQGEVEAFVAKVVETCGRIDILVNNAGTVRAGSFLALSNDDWEQQLGVHVLGMVNFCRAVIPHMQKRHWGRIINVVAGLATEPSLPFCIDYNAAKSAAGNLSKSLSTGFAKDNILVNCVSPGGILTPIHTEAGAFMDQVGEMVGLTRAQAMETTIRNVPLGRWGDPEELAAAVIFLASERASFITGINLIVDGGRRSGWV